MLVIAIWINSVEVKPVDRKELEKLPPSIAKVVIKKKEELKRVPLPEVKPAEAKKEEVAKPKEEKPAEVKPVEKPKAVTKEAKVAAARDIAKKSGVLAMKDDLAAMRKLSQSFAGLGGVKGLSNAGAKGTVVTRSQIVGKGTGGSGGIQTAAVPGSGGMGMGGGDGRGATQVDSVTLGGAVVDDGGDVAKAVESSRAAGTRSEESIRAILDQNKAALYSIYNRALREDPALQGRVTFKLVIESDGSVSSCSIVSSALSNSGLESKLVNRIRLINFGPEGSGSTTTNWVMDFLPY